MCSSFGAALTIEVKILNCRRNVWLPVPIPLIRHFILSLMKQTSIAQLFSFMFILFICLWNFWIHLGLKKSKFPGLFDVLVNSIFPFDKESFIHCMERRHPWATSLDGSGVCASTASRSQNFVEIDLWVLPFLLQKNTQIIERRIWCGYFRWLDEYLCSWPPFCSLFWLSGYIAAASITVLCPGCWYL